MSLRDYNEIAADADRVWTARGESKSSATKRRRSKRRRSKQSHSGSATRAALPKRIDVELATLVDEPPADDDWLHEIKYDGYRMICRIDDGEVQFLTRNHKDWTGRLASLAEAAGKLPVRTAILDGEVVALRADGTTDFQKLQNAFREKRADDLVYWVFDLLHLDGVDVSGRPLEERKRLLAKLLEAKAPAAIRFSEHVEGHGADFFKHGCEMHLEGIISKRRDAPYRPGRGTDWLKTKCIQKAEFVIGGFTDPERSREGLGALLVGYRKGKKLVYAGKVGTGFDRATLRDLTRKLTALERDSSPFADRTRAVRTHWVEPSIIAQVAYGAWTDDGVLRHASFQGMREDKSADEVTRDKARKVGDIARRRKPKLAASASRVAAKPHSSAKSDYDAQAQEFHGVRLTSPDKVLYPEQGITKLDLARYFRDVAEWMLPHLADRPLSLVRCPEGRGKECFFQKHPAPGTPKELRQVPIREKNKTETYVVVDDAAGLMSLAQIGALEVHAWGSRTDKLDEPDRLVFDLDPDPTVAWTDVVAAAVQIRRFLQDLDLDSFVKTTGGKGLHLVVPIERRHDWDAAKAFCKQVADAIATGDPDRYTASMSKRARVGKIYIDYLRNGRGATAIVPYSPRARAGAPVSTPLAWEELSEDLRSDRFTVENLTQRLASLKRDPWHGFAKVRQSLTRPIARLRKLA